MNASAQTRPPYPRRWAAATVMMAAGLMDMIDISIVNVALPSMARELHTLPTQLEWIVSAYLLTFASLLIAAGRLGDRFGHRRLFVCGVAGFGFASLVSAAAQSVDVLIAARAAQGAFAAIMVPQILASFRIIFDTKERGTAIGIYGALMGFSSAIGVLLGGVLTDADLFGWGWRMIFAVNVPIAVATLVATQIAVPATRATSRRKVDLTGSILLIASFAAITFPLLEGRRMDWPVWGWLCIAGGVATLVLLGWLDARRQRGDVAPIIPIALFRSGQFRTGVLIQWLFSICLQGFSLVFALWMQVGQHFSPTRAGLTMLAFSAGGFVSAPQAAALAVRFGRYVLFTGGLMMAAGMYALMVAAEHSSHGVAFWQLAPGLFIAGVGLGYLIVPLANVVLAAVGESAAGEASGIFSTAQQFGGAIGVATIGTVFFGRLDAHAYTDAFHFTMWIPVAALGVCALLTLRLPKTALSEHALDA